jgi:tetratricopeptide (TPR) repeat protein
VTADRTLTRQKTTPTATGRAAGRSVTSARGSGIDERCVRRQVGIAALITVAFVLGGCASPATTPRSGNPQTVTVSAPSGETQRDAQGEIADVARDRESAQASPRSGATAALLTASRNERGDGDLASAAATIERALSIAPDDALLWIELGEIRLEQGNRAAAEEMGRKALTLTGSNDALEARARRLIGR